MIDIYQDATTCNKLIFPSVLTHILTHAHILIPSSPLLRIMGDISKESLVRRATHLVTKAKWPHQESTPA